MFGAGKLKAEISRILRETQGDLAQAQSMQGFASETHILRSQIKAFERMLEKFVKLVDGA